MKATIEAIFDRYRPLFMGDDAKYGWAWPLYEGFETFWLTPGERSHGGAHVRDPFDMKRLMILVLYALVPCILMGWWNVGYQAYTAEGVSDFTLLDAVLRGGWHMLPIIITSYTAGGLAELVFSVVRGHEVNEGFLVTAMLFPLTLPPSIPLWMVAAGVIFGVVIGKEVFGGVGMNVLNPALTARAFVFFTYPAAISGAKVWDVAGTGWPMADALAPVDAYTGATPLLTVSTAADGPGTALAALHETWSFTDMALGMVPGSMGEVSAVGALLGAIFLVVVGLASWRTIVSAVAGVVVMAFALNFLGTDASPAAFFLPPHYHLVMGGFAFGAAFMATDPVSSSATNTGRWIYGFFIGVLCVLVRVVNPAYPEGMMLAILFMNVFAPLIDYFVVQRTTRRRAERLAAAA